ncbi:flagellar operon protein (TIGR03826 family) [Peribacillus deserti]|uniref:Flagellar operon protein (TIGR03826 family) n=1 Tax=Peribacillus deserti TaxID=673318 RepID=A0ABS2QCQ6_9BACI|nr:TIGR03826 family flagellar region protein [Peribacillus deserti]MBM7690882.1 flagellar operon protein (TIGR03826 family) [Peribacillus deserti]
MAELLNCPHCGSIFVQNSVRDVCEACYKAEQIQFETVYTYIRKRENRTATSEQVIEDTGIEKELLIKFIRTGKLKLAQFPNLGYPCAKCSTLIREGKLCGSCNSNLKGQLDTLAKEEARNQSVKSGNTFFIKR